MHTHLSHQITSRKTKSKTVYVLKLNFKSSLLSVNLIKMTMMIELLIYLGRVLFMGFSLATGQAMTRVWRCCWPNARSRWLEVCSNADQSDKNLTYSNTDQTPDRDDSTCPNADQSERKKLDSLKSWPIRIKEEEKLDLSKCWPIWNQPMCWPTIISPLSDNSWYLSWKKNIEDSSTKDLIIWNVISIWMRTVL